jgi:hypothetical protein
LLHKGSSHLALLLITLLVLPLESYAQKVRTRKIVCKRGTIRVTTINGVKKYSCVIKKKLIKKKIVKSQTEEVSSPFFNAPLRYQASWWGRLAARTVGSPAIASNRYRGYFESEQEVGRNTKFVFGARGTHDLMSNFQGNDFRDDFSKNKKPEIELWNFFSEHKHKGWRLRFGQQQVAWGETFGFFYADLVNPKDLRERSLGRLSELRLPTPMANIQWAGESLSFQFLYLPLFTPDRNPTPGSDFFPDLSSLETQPGLKLDTTSGYKMDDPKGDFGGRISGTIKGVDIALLYFNYIDRQPYYQLKPEALFDQRLLLQRRYRRIQSSGLTFSTEVGDGWIIRSENVYTPSRSFNAFDKADLIETESAQRVHVLGIDAPKFEKLHMGIQISNDLVSGGETPFTRAREISLTTLRLAYDLPDESLMEALVTHAFGGGGELIQATYTRPLTDIHELEIYWDQFKGSKNTFFGQTENASRVYIGFRGAFNG